MGFGSKKEPYDDAYSVRGPKALTKLLRALADRDGTTINESRIEAMKIGGAVREALGIREREVVRLAAIEDVPPEEMVARLVLEALEARIPKTPPK